MRLCRLSPSVAQMGYTASPLPLDEWLKLLASIESGQERATKQRVNLPPVILSCDWCGATFTRPAYRMRKALARGHKDNYCSLRCSEAHHAVKNRRKCRICGAPTATKTSLYCVACRPLARAQHPRAKHPAQVKRCPICNAAFRAIWRGRKAGKYQVYCSKRCAEIGHSRLMAGLHNPKWKNGATPLRQQPHSAKAYRTMRPFVLARDRHACVVCGEAAHLNVHHIDNWPMNNAASNLVTLCSKCHRRVHSALESKPPTTLWPWLSAYTSQPLFTTSR